MLPSARIIQAFPKADLHSHIDGSIPARELFKIAHENHREVKTPEGHILTDPGRFYNFVRGDGYHNLLDDIVNRFYPILGLMQTENTIREVGEAYAKGLKRDGVIYAEGRFAPHYHTQEGMTIPEVISSMLEGLRGGGEETGIQVNLIVAFGREVDIELAKKVVSYALRYAGRGVVGIDVGGAEAGHPPEKFQQAFRLTFDSALRRTVHAGEGAGSAEQNLRNIRSAITLLRADRIGHALNLSRDRELIELAKEKRVTVEMNPISNLVLRYISTLTELGIDRLLSAGVAVTVNSDDPALWPGGSLSDNLLGVCNAYNFGFEELETLITNSFSGAFISQEGKEALREEYITARRRLKS